jgi:putative component of membrane protein insertase Oxa1/YidC/SpoIIIJ protein YidD
MRYFYIMLLLQLSLFADPWGKDSDLVKKNENVEERCCRSYTPFLSDAAEKVIAFHQEVISPADGPRSHYIPSSSQYMLEAIRKHGFARGYCMGCDRLMRENNDPWVYRETVDGAGAKIKYDPIP